ncbi:MAG TPA: Flp pilus assembly protein CpaB [Pseudomonadales bacterium]
MHIRAIITLAIALIMGGITAFLVNYYLQKEVSARATSQVIETVPVVVAAADLQAGKALDRLQLKIVEWPKASVPESSYADIGKVLGDKPPVVLTRINRGEIILPYKLSPHGARGGIPSRIPEDRRAMSIRVNEFSGVGGFIIPGDYVDVLHTTALGRVDNRKVTRVLLQNLKVLGIDQVDAEQEGNPKVVNSVTLLVKLDEAQRLTLAQATGELTLLLRNDFDASILQHAVITYKELLSDDPEETRKPVQVYRRERRETPSVEVIRGLEVTKEQVQEGSVPQEQPQVETKP